MLCKYHYKRFCAENQCKEEGCKRLAKDGEGRCVKHTTEEHEESRCKTVGCKTPRKNRANYCDTCYMRRYRSSKRQGDEETEPIITMMEEGEDSDDRRDSLFSFFNGKETASDEIVSSGGTSPLVHKLWREGVCMRVHGGSMILRGSELGTAGKESVSVHFLQRMMASSLPEMDNGYRKGKRRRHACIGEERKRPKKHRVGESYNKSTPPAWKHGVCI